jgi:rod shape-determining protein MreC
MLAFQQKSLYKTVAAQIIGTSGSNQSQVFTIDKGNDYGLRRDMAVISADGIVGKVREVFPRSAQVLVINDQTSGAGVILETTRIRGILRGNADGQPQIVGILADQRIKPGEKVLTAGGDQIFPRGLPAGVVEKVSPDPDRDGFINIIVKPAAHLDQLDEVLVITSTDPRFSSEQQKDIQTSEEEKSAEAAALAEQRKASAIMAERLPGLTDPNAPPKPAESKPGENGANPATPTPAVVPKIIPPQHPDRFTPGHAGEPDQAAPAGQAPTGQAPAGQTPAARPTAKAPSPKPPATPGAGPGQPIPGKAPGTAEPKPKSPAPTTPQPQRREPQAQPQPQAPQPQGNE